LPEQATSAVPSLAPNTQAVTGETSDCPSPVLPERAFFLGQYANLELTITANRDGSLQRVVISKKSQARLYDEYTRSWVEKYWKMPLAKPGEPDVRRFIAPIVYPKNKMPPGGRYPPPNYPASYMANHVEGLLIIEMVVAPSGEIESARTILSSGHKGLDAHTEEWVRKRWRFPAGEKRTFHWPVAYLMN
jgi:TonB family protein